VRTHRGLRFAIALVFYLVVVAGLTWPMAPRAAHHLPGTGQLVAFDSYLVMWALSHESRALATDPKRFSDGGIYHPATRTLFYAEAGFGALPYFLPTYLLTGNPILAFNLTWMLSTALAAFGIHWVVRRWTGSGPAGFVSACAFLTTLWVLRWPTWVPNYAVVQYLAPIIFLAAIPLQTLRGALCLLPLVVLQCLSGIYFVPAVLGPLAVVAIARLARARSRGAGLRLLAVVGLAIPITLLAYLGYFLVRLENPDLTAQTTWRASAAAASPFRGLELILDPRSPAGVPAAALLLAGAGAASLLLRRSRGERDRSHAAWLHAATWTGAGILMASSPPAGAAGGLLTWPYRLLAEWTPLYELIRVPMRLAVPSLIGLSLLAGLGLAELSKRVPIRTGRRPVLELGIGLLFVVAMLYGFPPTASSARRADPWPAGVPRLHALGSFPTRAAPDRGAPLLAILREPGGPLIELPAAPNPASHAEAMYRSIYHQRRILNGYSSYWPEGFPERMALADRLPDPDALAELERTTGLTTVLVHLPRLSPAKRESWQALAEGSGESRLRLVARDRSRLVFSVETGDETGDVVERSTTSSHY
jgi:hypothetical protein